MAVPPIIPTSFVPHPGGSSAGRNSPMAVVSVLTALGFFAFFFALVAAGGVFVYNNILASEQATKDAKLATAESSLDQTTIEQFLRLRDRFASARTLLNNHDALSGLFNLLSSVTPGTTRFNSVSIVIDDKGQGVVEAAGVAKSFNALAVASDDFSTDARLRNAIFSNIAIGPKGSVKFMLSASLDPRLIAYAPVDTVTPSAAPTATTSASTTTAATSSPQATTP
jgi:hypothetical protein